MSQDYVEKRIREALKLSRGNAANARQQIIAWTREDMKLLQAITRPHMLGIVAHAVGHVMNRKETPPPAPPPAVEDDPKHAFGMEILRAVAGEGSPRFGQENAGPPLHKQPASQRHIDAINQLAGKRSSRDE
ncbi:MAG: hypothetical protein H6853_05675 [Rhodospirillales bacterium]|nr:hypothetical protein [Alphaproteobacteria bacterium]USO03035.1 MAG: hypothetical protein H6853_05675 [Rhodospirillales bacterium]